MLDWQPLVSGVYSMGCFEAISSDAHLYTVNLLTGTVLLGMFPRATNTQLVLKLSRQQMAARRGHCLRTFWLTCCTSARSGVATLRWQ